MIYNLKITIEHKDEIKVSRERCYGEEALAEARRQHRTMAPTGSTVTFEQE